MFLSDSEKIMLKFRTLVFLGNFFNFLIKLKNKLPILNKTRSLEKIRFNIEDRMAKFISELLEKNFKKTQEKIESIKKQIKQKSTTKTKAKVTSKAKKPKKVAKAQTKRK